MKAKMLKIAGVKSEKEFYKKFPDEASFMKAHGKEFKKAMRGSKIEKAQRGYALPPQQSDYPDYESYMEAFDRYMQRATQPLEMAPTTQTAPLQRTPLANVKNMGTKYVAKPLNTTSTTTEAPENTEFKPAPYIQAGVDVVQGISMIKDQRDAVLEALQSRDLTNVQARAIASQRTQPIKRQYVRPEDVVFQPQQMSPSYGVGTNVLAQDGTVIRDGIGGTPTEIMNVYNPGTMYTDLGYEPLNDTEKMKQYLAGGNLPKADDGFQTFMTKGGGNQLAGNLYGIIEGDNPEAGNKIGKGIGSAIGTAVGGPLGGAVGGLLGSTLGGLIDRSEEKIRKYQEEASKNIGNIMGQQMGMNIQNRFSSHMQDGGTTSPYEWVSHTWQPRTITTFGEHKLKDLLKPPHDADMLRAGGHLKEYTPPSAAAMSTERPAMQEGGELQTHWGGYAEPMSYNPYLPDGGETIMFRGQSHDESDGRGNTGIGITFGENPVEVERGEPAVKLKDGGTGESNLTVFGNIKITNAFADMLADPKAKGKKFKTYVADLSKQENKQNKLMEKSVDELDNLDVRTSFDQLKLGTLHANMQGANAKLKDLAEKKMNAAALQNAINDSKEEELLEVTDSGDVKARKGANIPKAQGGTRISDTDYKELRTLFDVAAKEKYGPAVLEFQRKFHKLFPNEAKKIIATMGPTTKAKKEFKGDVTKLEGNEDMYFGPRTEQYMATAEKIFSELPRTAVGIPGNKKINVLLPMEPSPTPSKVNRPAMTPTKTQVPGWMAAFNQLLPYLRPSDVEQLNPNQLIGEMYALSQNQVEPVYAQKFIPELATPYDISLQDILNENQATYNATARQTGYNPAALASLNAQKYMANQRVLGEQFRLNQAEKDKVYSENRNLLNQAKLQNLQILERQADKQATALSKTKATTQEALNSIASKYAQNKLENRTLAVMENMYGYRFDRRFRAINMNPLAQFDTTVGGSSGTGATGGLAPGYEFTYNADGNIIGTRRSSKDETGRNGAILKALKNL